jgi:hypothetical protein
MRHRPDATQIVAKDPSQTGYNIVPIDASTGYNSAPIEASYTS